jgi:hypothetical protein
MTPYVDCIVEEYKIRTFDPDTSSPKEYIWHRDHNDREIEVLEGEGWSFQFDNELPKIINRNDQIYIPKMVYHRIIPGKTKLRIKINEKL